MHTPNKARILRHMLHQPEPVLAAGAHNGLSALLVERAGFAAVWASGFEISTSFALPDANSLSMGECLQVVRSMNTATELPVVADCDTGFGDAINVRRTVQEYERAGVAAICIEDSVFPKRCSLYPGFERAQVSPEEFAGKIRAAKGAQYHKDFMVLARTETLVAGGSMEEALRRGRLYADAGADMVLVHSKAPHPAEVLAFAAAWDRSTPLVCVPTTYNTICATELAAAGYRMMIYANHGIRAAIAAMQEVFTQVRLAMCTAGVEKRIAPLSTVYDLVDVNALSEHEKQFIPGAAAGPHDPLV